RQMKLNQRRRTGSSLPRRKGTDPLLKAQARQTERNRLIHFLKRNRKRSFSAAQLKKDTNIPKSRVRSLLATSRRVSITRHGSRYIFQSRLPKRRRKRTFQRKTMPRGQPYYDRTRKRLTESCAG